jgi:hypothetical protein
MRLLSFGYPPSAPGFIKNKDDNMVEVSWPVYVGRPKIIHSIILDGHWLEQIYGVIYKFDKPLVVYDSADIIFTFKNEIECVN